MSSYEMACYTMSTEHGLVIASESHYYGKFLHGVRINITHYHTGVQIEVYEETFFGNVYRRLNRFFHGVKSND